MKVLRYRGGFRGFCTVLIRILADEAEGEFCLRTADGGDLFAADDVSPAPEPMDLRELRPLFRERFGDSAFPYLRHAWCAAAPGREDCLTAAVFNWRRWGACAVEASMHPAAVELRRMALKTAGEKHRFLGLLRFEQGPQGLISRIRPETDLLELLAPFFVSRCPSEPWTIEDARRGKVAVFTPGTGLHYSCSGRGSRDEREMETGEADPYRRLWKGYVDNMEVRERRNTALQKKFVPLKYRDGLPEFDP